MIEHINKSKHSVIPLLFRSTHNTMRLYKYVKIYSLCVCVARNCLYEHIQEFKRVICASTMN